MTEPDSSPIPRKKQCRRLRMCLAYCTKIPRIPPPHIIETPGMLIPRTPLAHEKSCLQHVVCFRHWVKQVFELDGLKSGPVLLGEIPSCSSGDNASGDWLRVVSPAIEERIARYASGEIRFNLMAIVKNRRWAPRAIFSPTTLPLGCSGRSLCVHCEQFTFPAWRMLFAATFGLFTLVHAMILFCAVSWFCVILRGNTFTYNVNLLLPFYEQSDI